jgi:2'-phosphotransferase/ERI1 exoribonuclease 3
VINIEVAFKHWCNSSKEHSRRRGKGAQQFGMPGMLQALGLPLVGRHHSGIDDSRNIAAILRELGRRGAVL